MTITLRTGAVLVAAAALAVSTAQPVTAAPAAGKAGKGVDAVVATVNGEKITRAQLIDEAIADESTRLSAKNPQAMDMSRMPAAQFYALIDAGDLVVQRLKTSGGAPVTISRSDYIDAIFRRNSPALADALQNKIREIAIRQAGERAGIKVSKSDLDKQFKTSIAQVSAQYPDLKGKSSAAVLASFGVREEFIRRNLLIQAVLDKLVRKQLDKKLGHPVGPGDFVEARQILVTAKPEAAKPETPGAPAPPPSDAAREKAFADAKVKIDADAADLKAGKRKFEEIARDNDDQTKFREGSLGVFMRGSMVPEFDKAVFSMKKGEVSDPIRTQYGWHIIRVDRTGAEISDKERDQVIEESMRGQMTAVIQDIVKSAKVTNLLPPQRRAAGSAMQGMRPQMRPMPRVQGPTRP